jgi:hypothetical protein
MAMQARQATDFLVSHPSFTYKELKRSWACWELESFPCRTFE